MKGLFIIFYLLLSLFASAQKADVIDQLSKVPVLCYHQVRNWENTDSKSSRAFIIPCETFIQHIKTLRESGYNTITIEELVAYISGRSSLPAKPVLITFDDGTTSQYVNALPVLERYRMKAVFFIMTVTVDHHKFMTRSQIKDLANRGYEIGCHTWDHHPATKYIATADYEHQFLKPKKDLEQITGKQILYLAYPYGAWNMDAIKYLQVYGYKAAFQLKGHYDQQAPLFTINRILIDGHWDASRLLKEIIRITK